MRIVCANAQPNGHACGRYLGDVEAGKVRIYCPQCKRYHELSVIDLMAHLQEYLDATAAKAESRKALVGYV